MAKVIQVLVNPDTATSQGCFLCLCEDGTIWDWSIRNCKPGEGIHRWHPVSTPDSQAEEKP